jgi:hypothetical protein
MIYYTLDGADPRANREAKRGGRRVMLSVSDGLQIKACVKSRRGEWSAMAEMSYQPK